MGKKPRGDKSLNDKIPNQVEHPYNEHTRNDGNASYDDYKEANREQVTHTKYGYRQSPIQDTKDYSSFKVVLFHCSLIVFLPILFFFILKSIVLDSLFALSEVQVNIYAATGAVIGLHIALGFYIYSAYFGTDKLLSSAIHKKLK